MALSPRAERLLPQLRVLLADIEKTLTDERFDPRTTNRAFRIAATDDAIEIILTPFIIDLRNAAPNALVDIVAVSEVVANDLAAGKIDVAVTADWWLRQIKSREHLFTDRYAGLSARRRKFSLAEYVKAEHVLVAPHGRKTGVVDTALKEIGRVRRVSVTVPDFASAARLVASSGMLTTMPSRIAAHLAQHYSLHVFQPPVALEELSIGVGSSVRAQSDPAVRWLIEQIKAHAAAIDQ
jgi:DNA-binding transcriptional LysR family regulator